MAQFNYAEYAATVAAAQNKEKSQGVKVGFFKLADGAECLVRFNVSKVEDLAFASTHRVKRNPEDRFCGMSVSCLNALGHTGECPLCAAVDAGDERVQKVGKRVFVQMMVAYKDPSTDFWAAPVPVIWERPAGFYKEIMTKLSNYGDLTQHLFKITRTGALLDTVYSIDYAVPAVFKPELVPADFSAFEGFNVAKHSYWEKTAEECEEYLRTGKFPEVVRADTPIATPVVSKAETTAPAKAAAEVAATVTTAAQSTPTMTPIPEVDESAHGPEAPKATPNNFGGFSF